MSESQNTQVVKDAYAAFGRGDINAILNSLADTIEWEAIIGAEGVVPTAGLRRGRAGVAEFFQTLAKSLDFENFEPRQFVAQGDTVVTLGHYRAKAKHNGAIIDSDWVMIFTLRDGKVVKFREFADTAQAVRQWTMVAA